MSHSVPVFSSDGTALPDRTVGEIVASDPGLARVFQAHHIDFCCQGGRTLREACQIKGLDPEAVAAQLEAAQHAAPPADTNPALLPPAALIEYIVETHHAYLRAELPRLGAMAVRVARVHGGHTPSLVEVNEIFQEMAAEMDEHTHKEEMALFPAIAAMSHGGRAMPLDAPITCMMLEHDDVGEALRRLRALTHDYEAPPEACNTYRALFAGLRELESDLHRHIHLENTVLFPAALRLAGSPSFHSEPSP